jgi:hypothetical protein
MAITVLSVAAHALPVDDSTELATALNVVPAKFPEYTGLPMPKPEGIRIFRGDANSDLRP